MILLKIHPDSHRVKIVKVDHFPFSIGRSIDSSYILDHPSISIHHCFFDINSHGDLYLQDCRSKNGLYTNGDKIEKQVIVENSIFYLGEMKMEVIISENTYDKTREIHIPLEVFHGEGNWRKILLVPLLSYFFLLLPEILKIQLTDPLIQGEWGPFVFQLISLTLGSTLLSCVFAFISKIHLKKYQMLRFIKDVNTWLCGANCLSMLLPFLLFPLDSLKIQFYIKFSLTLVIFFFFFYTLLQKIFHKLESWGIFLHSFGVICLGIIFRFAVDFYDTKGNSTEFTSIVARPWFEYSADTYPERNLWIKLEESAHFIEKDRIQRQKKRTQIGFGQFRSSPKGGG